MLAKIFHQWHYIIVERYRTFALIIYMVRARTLFILSTPATIALAQTVAIEKVDT